MTLVYCRHCGGQLDETAASCPHCTAGQPSSTPPAVPASAQRSEWLLLRAVPLCALGGAELLAWLPSSDTNPGKTIIWLLMLASGVIAPLLAVAVRERVARAVHQKLLLANAVLAAVLALLYGLAVHLDIRFSNPVANVAYGATLYAAGCYLIAFDWGMAVALIIGLPIAAACLLGPFALLLALADVATGGQGRPLGPNLSCKATAMEVLADTGHVYQSWDGLAFLERELGKTGDPSGQSCEAILARLPKP